MQSGTPLFALQELGGWASTEMVRRYAHLAADHLAPYAEKLCRPLTAVPERLRPKSLCRKVWAHFGHSRQNKTAHPKVSR